MKRLKYILIIAIGCFVFGLQSCQEEYYIDGGMASPELNMSTYQFIAGNDEFSMSKYIIDKDEDLKTAIDNSNNTVFVPRNKNIEGFIAKMAWGDEQFEHFEQARFDVMIDAMKQYVYDQRLRFEDAPSLGKKEIVSIDKDTLNIYKLQTPYKGVQRAGAEYLYLDKEVENPKTGEIQYRLGMINTSNLVSTNGMVHVMDYDHTFGFDF